MILIFEYSGAGELAEVLAGHPSLACTSGTGILPLCAQATATWRHLEDSPAGISTLAASSVRALVSTMITATLAAAGGRRWCEIATAVTAAAPFARLFPQAQFVCFYRACSPVICDVTGASRWGLGAARIGDFAARYPGNNVAAAAAYWCAGTRALLDFEAAHSRQSLRVRHEDLTDGPAAAASAVMRFLGLGGRPQASSGVPADAEGMALTAVPSGPGPEQGQQFPAGLLPAPMLDRINRLQAALGYQPLLSGPA